ncbi:MAG: type II secretion system protein [Ruminococcaceae bacterium]|nr:type II secretion system protein [Oscillospiraceae bacterium]
MKIRNKNGFTLMEILIVVAIIAVLVAIAIPVVTGLKEKARVAADAATMRTAQSAFAIQEMTTGVKPGQRAVYDNISGTFIEWDDYVDAGKWETYKYYGQAYNNDGGRTLGGTPSVGTNGHIYVDVFAISDYGSDYGPDALVWWADNKKANPGRWGK